MLLLFAAAPDALAVDGRVQIGYPTGSTSDEIEDDTAGRNKYRDGTWVPVCVDLFNDETGREFTGTLRILQRDRDGDLVATDQPVSVRGPRRYWLFPVAGPRRADEPFAVQLLNAEGNAEPIRSRVTGKAADKLLPAEQPLRLSSEDLLILDISDRPVVQLHQLAARGRQNPQPGDAVFNRPVVLGRKAARDLPPHWCGLDMVNVIVWDNPDPAVMTDPHQLRALTDWVKRGGLLVLGVARTWDAVQRSELGPLLPGPLTAAREDKSLPELAMFSKPDPDAPDKPPGELKTAVTLCPLNRADLRPGSRVLYPTDPNAGRVIVCRRAVGRGQLVYVGARLRDLYDQLDRTEDLAAQLVGLRKEPRSEQRRPPWTEEELFPRLSRLVGFETLTGLYFLFAFVFVVTYILASTFGVWRWLRSKGWQRYSWTAFAALAVAASLISLGAVRVIRGIGYDVEELSVIDLRAADAGQVGTRAYATSLYGLATGSHDRLDLILPQNWADLEKDDGSPRSLRPLPPEPGMTQEFFATPDLYHMVPQLAKLANVPFRATLKQFLGTWEGEIRGQVTASLATVRRGMYQELDERSWIKNELGVDLYGCWLLQADVNPEQLNPARWAENIRAVKVGNPPGSGILRNGDTAARLDLQAYGDSIDPLVRTRFAPRLSDLHKQWARMFGVRSDQGFGVEQPDVKVTSDMSEAALLLLTTFAEIRQTDDDPTIWSARTLGRTHLVGLDVSDLITKETMLLVGFSDAPGPARLCCRPGGSTGRYRYLKPRTALTMYRVLIPVKARN